MVSEWVKWVFDTFIHAVKRLLFAHKNVSWALTQSPFAPTRKNNTDKFGGLVSQVKTGTLAGVRRAV